MSVKNNRFSEFLNSFKKTLSKVFGNVTSTFNTSRKISPEEYSEIMSHNPLSAFIPEVHGGRARTAKEGLQVLEAASYQSLPLSLMMGINGALFLQPVSRFAHNSVKASVLRNFTHSSAMGGLMITEPDFGSDALKMQTEYTSTEKGFRVKGTKHWGGLTGRADFWLLTARKKSEKGTLQRDIDFFVYDSKMQGIQVEEYYDNLGLYPIPYGRNIIDVEIPSENRLQPESTGIKMMLDILHRSRTQFPGMAMGYLRRMLDEAVDHCKSRFVGGKSLFNYEQVKRRLAKLQSAYTISSAMCYWSGNSASLEKDLSSADISSNSIKSVVTDLMHEASQSLLQLVGAKGYTINHIAGRSLVDSRPFQIFEGSNDILYQQISESVIKQMKKINSLNLYDYLKGSELTNRATEYVRDLVNVSLDVKMAQDKLVLLGKALGRIVSLEYVLGLYDTSFNRDLIQNAVDHLREEIQSLMCTYYSMAPAQVVENYGEQSDWSLLS